MTEQTKCFCGKPLHYSDLSIKAKIDELVKNLGEKVTVTHASGKSYAVPRHYIALHGLKAWELDQLGFEEVHG